MGVASLSYWLAGAELDKEPLCGPVKYFPRDLAGAKEEKAFTAALRQAPGERSAKYNGNPAICRLPLRELAHLIRHG